MLEGENLKLRLLELKDLDFLYSVENNKSYFKFSSHPQYYSKEELKEFISNSTDDITLCFGSLNGLRPSAIHLDQLSEISLPIS